MKVKGLTWLMVSLVVAISLIIGGCAPAVEVPEVPEEPEEKALHFTIVGGTIGGTGNLKANLCAGILKKWAGVDSTVLVLVTMAHPDALRAGVADISVHTNTFQHAWLRDATGVYAGSEPYPDLRSLIPATANFMMIHVPVDSTIQTFRDLVGKRISTGVTGQTSGTTFDMLCEAIGLDPERDFDRYWLSWPECGAALLAGKLDAFISGAQPPIPALVEIDIRTPLKLVSFSEEDIANVEGKKLGLSPVTIPGKYYHMTEPVKSLQYFSCWTTTDRLPEDIAYTLVKSYLENPDYLGYFHSSFPGFVTEGYIEDWVKNLDLAAPYHVGAYRYYQEIGWTVPTSMIPPVAK